MTTHGGSWKQEFNPSTIMDQELRSLSETLAADTYTTSYPAAGVKAPQGHVPGTGLEFEDLTYTVVKKQKKDGTWVTREVDLLHGISGVASRGQVTAVMGPSGAGKSTLLDALAGRIASGSLAGITTVDGKPVTPSLMKRISAYVMQDDQLFPMLTVWETLWFAAEVRLGHHLSRGEKRARVTKLIDQLGLTRAQNTYIGDEGTRGISGGEKRRVSIGVDIIHGPSLLFLDEPTSGLDSTSAFSVIQKVHDIALEGSTVVLTIHQPSYRIQQLLNRLIILARGQLIYSGSPNYLPTHISVFGREVPRGENAIEYLLDVIQEYDQSTLGLEPLVTFNATGTNNTAATPLVSRASTGYTMQKGPLQAALDRSIQMEDRSMFAKSPLGINKDKSNVYKMDESMDAMEIGNMHELDDDLEDAFDHSLTYYNRFLGGLADKFMSPLRTPLHAGPSPALSSRTPLRNPVQVHHFNKPWQEIKESKYSPFHPLQSQVSQFASQSNNLGKHDPQGTSQSSSQYTPDLDDHGSSNNPHGLYGPKFANTWWREVLILMKRNVKNIQRTPELFMSRQMVLTVMGLMMATLFTRLKHHLTDLDGVTQIMSFFIFTVCLFFFSSNDAVPTFIQERFIYIRETSHNAYRASAYVIADVITYLPFLALQAMTYTLITWWAMGFKNLGANPFIFFWLVLFVSLMCTGSFVMFISALLPNYVLGYAAVIAFTALFFLTCGYFLKRESIPGYWIWLHYMSTLKYPYEALLLNEFDDPKHQPCYAFLPFPNNSTCALTGKDLLVSLSVTQGNKYNSLFGLFAWAVFYRVLFYFVLRFASKNQRT